MRRAFIAIAAACVVLASNGAVHAQTDEYKDAEQIIHEHCKQAWPDDFYMRNFCEEQEHEALAKLKARQRR